MNKQYNQEPTLAQVSCTSTPLSSIAPATQSDTLRLLNLLLVLRNLRTPAAPRRSSGGGPLSLPSPPPPARSIISFLTSLHPPLTHRNPRQTSAAYQVARLYETLLRACIPLNFITFSLNTCNTSPPPSPPFTTLVGLATSQPLWHASASHRSAPSRRCDLALPLLYALIDSTDDASHGHAAIGFWSALTPSLLGPACPQACRIERRPSCKWIARWTHLTDHSNNHHNPRRSRLRCSLCTLISRSRHRCRFVPPAARLYPPPASSARLPRDTTSPTFPTLPSPNVIRRRQLEAARFFTRCRLIELESKSTTAHHRHHHPPPSTPLSMPPSAPSPKNEMFQHKRMRQMSAILLLLLPAPSCKPLRECPFF